MVNLLFFLITEIKRAASGLTSCVATSRSVSITAKIGLMSKSEGAPFGGSRRRPLGSRSLHGVQYVEHPCTVCDDMTC